MSKKLQNRDIMKVRSVTITDLDKNQTRREKLAKIILDEMFQFVGLTTTEGILLEVNRAALEGGGITFEDIQGKPFWDVHWWTISAETQIKLQESIARAANGEFIRYDVDVYGSKSGSEIITIDFSIIPIKDNNGKVVFCYPREETLLKRYKQSLRSIEKTKSFK